MIKKTKSETVETVERERERATLYSTWKSSTRTYASNLLRLRLNKLGVILSIIVLSAIVMMQFSNISRNEIIESVIQGKKAETEGEVTNAEPQIGYEVMTASGTTAQILIIITDEENGIKQVEYPDGHTVYCNGDEKREKLAIDYEAELGGEYIFKITTGDGKETEKKIVVINNFEVVVSGISQTGFNMNLSLTAAELAKVEEIKYYVNDSLAGTNYQTSNVVTGLGDYTNKYVWAEVIYNSGKIKKSKTYKIVYTKHNHNNSCYEWSRYQITNYICTFDSKLGSRYYDTVKRTKCDNCSYIYSTRKCSWTTYLYSDYQDTNTMEWYNTSDGHPNCGEINCINLNDDDDWSTNSVSVYPRYCKTCKANFFDMNSTSDGNVYKCSHYLTDDFLICSKPTNGKVYNYNF